MAAFAQSGLTSVVLPEGMLSLGMTSSAAFANCSSLTKAVLPSTLQGELGREMFRGTALTTITVPEGVTKIGAQAFMYSYYLTNVSLPMGDSLTAIETDAFALTGLKQVSIPSSVQQIDTAAFQNTKLTSVTIPNGVIVIEEAAFFQCIKLKNATFPSTLLAIGQLAFDGTALTYVEISDEVNVPIDSFPDGCKVGLLPGLVVQSVVSN